MDKIAKIKELHQLHKDGALTEEKFNAEKKKLMSDDGIEDAAVVDSGYTEAEIIPDLETMAPEAPQAPQAPVAPTPPVSLNDQYAKQQEQATYIEAEPVRQQYQPQQTHVHNNITYAPPRGKRANGFAITGFIFSLIGIIPWIGWILLPFGLILSIVGLCLNGKKYKKGLAVAGLIISLIVIAAWVVIFFFVSEAYDYDRFDRYDNYDYYDYNY